jgi:hypothetical protein
MVVRHPELVEKARKKAEYKKRFKQRLTHDPEAQKTHQGRLDRFRARIAADPAFRERRRLSAAAATAKRDPDQLLIEARERMRRLRSDPSKRTEQAELLRRRRKKPKYRAIASLRKAVHRVTKGGQKRFRSSKYLGIDLHDAKQYIESMLSPDWTWDNHGKAWQIDHIFPVAKANLSDPIERIAVSNYRNLRPLSVAENRAKSDKVTAEALLLFEELKREAAATLAAAQIRA